MSEYYYLWREVMTNQNLIILFVLGLLVSQVAAYKLVRRFVPEFYQLQARRCVLFASVLVNIVITVEALKA